jgi:hypothetical protein
VLGRMAPCFAAVRTSKRDHSSTPLKSLSSVLRRTKSVMSQPTFLVMASAAPSLAPMAA